MGEIDTKVTEVGRGSELPETRGRFCAANPVQSFFGGGTGGQITAGRLNCEEAEEPPITNREEGGDAESQAHGLRPCGQGTCHTHEDEPEQQDGRNHDEPIHHQPHGAKGERNGPKRKRDIRRGFFRTGGTLPEGNGAHRRPGDEKLTIPLGKGHEHGIPGSGNLGRVEEVGKDPIVDATAGAVGDLGKAQPGLSRLVGPDDFGGAFHPRTRIHEVKPRKYGLPDVKASDGLDGHPGVTQVADDAPVPLVEANIDQRRHAVAIGARNIPGTRLEGTLPLEMHEDHGSPQKVNSRLTGEVQDAGGAVRALRVL